MSRFFTLMKMNLKLLLRNKAFLFFLCLTPIVSVIILNIKSDNAMVEVKEERNYIVELEKCSTNAIYEADTSAFVVKVYDASHTELSEYMLNKLSESGMYSICRGDASGMSEEEVLEQAKNDAFEDRAGVLLYLKMDFDKAVMTGNYAEAMQLYDVSEDERWELFEGDMSRILSQIHQLALAFNTDQAMVMETLASIEEAMPEKEVVSLDGKDSIALTKEQNNQKALIGYAFAIITLGFLFCGVCVAHTVIEEQGNKVYTRLMLSRLSLMEYLGAKLCMTILISIMQTGVLGICMFIFKDLDFGMNKVHFLCVVFFLGLIFSVISFVIGVLVGDVMTSNYAVFAVWSISAMLAGLYFPIEDTSAALRTISYLMPQRWFMKVVEMMFVGDNGAYSMIIYITIAYLVVVMSIGSIGLKMKRVEA